MSDGKTFNSSKDLSNEDRLTELERKIPIYMERLQQYDGLFDKIKDLQALITLWGLNHDQLVRKTDELKKEQQQQNNILTARQDGHVLTLNNIMTNFEKHKSELNDQLRLLTETQSLHMRHIDSVKKCMAESSIKTISKDELDQFKDSVNSLHSAMAERIRNVVDRVVTLNDNSDSLSNTIHYNNNHILNEISSIRNSTNELRENMSIDRFKIRDLDEKTLPVVKKEISSSIDALKKELSQNVVNPNIIKDELQKKLDLVEMDGKNALLRSVNSEKQVEMMKKQIENIYLLLKKHELSQ
jgi:hypothetical protein